MSTNVLTVTEAVRHFSDYISRVAYRHESFVLRRGNKPIAQLRPMPQGRKLGDLPAVIRSLPHLPTGDVKAFATDIGDAHASLAHDTLREPWES